MKAIVPQEDEALERVRAEIRQLRAEIIERYVELDELRAEEAMLTILYEQRLGPAHIRALELEWELARLRRKLSLLMVALNRGETPDHAKITAILDEELRGFQDAIRDAKARFHHADRALLDSKPIADYARVKQLYREIVRALHPDLHGGDLSGERLLLWTSARMAFERGDVAELERIHHLVIEEKPSSKAVQAEVTELDFLERDRTRLKRLRKELEKRRAALLGETPLNLRNELHDPLWVAEKRAEILKNEARNLRIIDDLRERILALKRASMPASERKNPHER